MNRKAISTRLNLVVGETVEVRSREEILAMLDSGGCLDGLPFMPEMFAFCGKRLRVYKRAHKTCDTINYSGIRRMTNTVHLDGARCSGQAHGDCHAECLIFWKEAWLQRVAGSLPDPRVDEMPGRGDRMAATESGHVPECSEAAVSAATCKAPDPKTGEPVYVCQATRLLEASSPVSRWDLKQYWEDYASGNVSLRRLLGVLCYASYNGLLSLGRAGGWFRRILFWLYNGFQLLRGGSMHPRKVGRIPARGATPSTTLNLQPGELVRVKSFKEILETIDVNYYNRGMKWDAEMVPYCGGVYRVKRRVHQIIDEKTGRMLRMKSGAVILEDVICQSKYSECRYLCPRSIYPYWREIWLERVDASKAAPAEVEAASGK